jgi:hypothetical protein
VCFEAIFDQDSSYLIFDSPLIFVILIENQMFSHVRLAYEGICWAVWCFQGFREKGLFLNLRDDENG